jgi:hypothetical protein
LDIKALKKNETVLCAEMVRGEEFVLSFIHSVNKRPVYDTFRVEDDHLVVMTSRFDAFGAGMPESSTDEGTLQVDRNGWLVWTVNRPVPEVTIFVGWVADHTLHVKGRGFLLRDRVDPGTALSIRVRKASFFEVWKGMCVR